MARDPRHILYHDLLAAAGRSGCCVCCCLHSGEDDYVRRILSEHVTDVAFRRRWLKAAGLCARHAHQLADIGDALGSAILYQSLLAGLLNGPMATATPRAKHFAQWVHTPGKLPACPACAHLDDYRNRLIEGLCRHAPNAEFFKVFDAGDGLCLAHLVDAIAVAPRDVRDYLVTRHRQRWVELEQALVRLIGSFDPNRRAPGELDEATKDAFARAIDVMTGER